MKIATFVLISFVVLNCYQTAENNSTLINSDYTIREVFKEFNSINWNLKADSLQQKSYYKKYDWLSGTYSEKLNHLNRSEKYIYEIRKLSNKINSMYQHVNAQESFEMEYFFSEVNNQKFCVAKNIYTKNNIILDSYIAGNFFFKTSNAWISFQTIDFYNKDQPSIKNKFRFKHNVDKLYAILILDSNLTTQKKIVLNKNKEIEYIQIFKNDKYGNLNEIYFLYPQDKILITENTEIEPLLKLFNTIPTKPNYNQYVRYLADVSIFNHKEWNAGYLYVPTLVDESYILNEFKIKKINPIKILNIK